MTARDRILAKLRRHAAQPLDDSDYHIATEAYRFTADAGRQRVRQLLEAAHAEVHEVTADGWPAKLADCLQARGLRNLLIAPRTAIGAEVAHHWQGRADLPELRSYDRPVEEWKEELFFDIDASITGCLGAIAATGSLVLWPSADEPRLMSLVPPLHIVVLDAGKIWNTLFDAMTEARWAAGLPTNALLVSGPSKTADIQQTLAYGAHGPKELIVLMVQP
ncbi:lactate utilization protein [Chitinivorax sp. PXF-14]|uniref:LutC/YkgG family protein n=1 Tax=Chitinivorax sp. PXF-14 TaxID=3230488 RepID=UPI003466B272